ncbi:hypothetical protein DNTS_033263 [Danionella cerebrum]|uniref:Max-binding protein MNT n=1 Tax=Danionella cerebrum TaxID=2873325 RepID=A0A553RL41_9TELE|nr:hypothetical protein DNTS_033263 [Danionella translucida]
MVSANPVQPSLQNPSILHTASSVPVLRPLPSDLSPKPHLLNTKDGHSPPQQQHQNLMAQGKVEAYSLPSSNTSPNQQQPPTLLQMFPAPIITAQQPPQQQHQALLPQPAQCQPQTSPVHFQAQVQCQAPAQVQGEAPQLSLTNGATLEDLRNLEAKRRPGGAGTREVHNKLEKNRRAHLKECFETLKRNVPNVDEKKTSNLSVLRSALRYIQLRHVFTTSMPLPCSVAKETVVGSSCCRGDAQWDLDVKSGGKSSRLFLYKNRSDPGFYFDLVQA